MALSRLSEYLQLDTCVIRGGVENVPLPAPVPDPLDDQSIIKEHEHGTLLLRNRTSAFIRLRKLHSCQPAEARQAELPGSPVQETSDDLKNTYEQFLQVHSSLALKLGQHDGIKQFGLEFPSRAPPFEYQMMLPELEASIESGLEKLHTLMNDLRRMPLPSSTRSHEVQANILAWMSDLCAKEDDAYKQQVQEMRKVAKSSPKFSPVIHPMGLFAKRLTAAMGSSPVLSTTGSNISPFSLESLPTDSPPVPSFAAGSGMPGTLKTIKSAIQLHDELSDDDEPSGSRNPFEAVLSF
jgi:hypothetical protein